MIFVDALWGSASHRAAALVALFVLAATSGCATIVSGTTERIRFESSPPGAQVRVDGRSYTTPAAAELSRKNNYDVQFEKNDYLPATRQVTRDTNGWVWGNILIGGLIGLVVDYSTGAANDLEPDLVSVDLVRTPPPPASNGTPGEDQSHARPAGLPASALPTPHPGP